MAWPGVGAGRAGSPASSGGNFCIAVGFPHSGPQLRTVAFDPLTFPFQLLGPPARFPVSSNSSQCKHSMGPARVPVSLEDEVRGLAVRPDCTGACRIALKSKGCGCEGAGPSALVFFGDAVCLDGFLFTFLL